MESPSQSCTQWKCGFSNMRHCWVFSAQTNKRNQELAKSYYCNIRDDIILLFSLVYTSLGIKNPSALIPWENLLFYQKCAFCQMNADVHARTGALCNWKTAENRKKKEVHSCHALNCL